VSWKYLIPVFLTYIDLGYADLFPLFPLSIVLLFITLRGGWLSFVLSLFIIWLISVSYSSLSFAVLAGIITSFGYLVFKTKLKTPFSAILTTFLLSLSTLVFNTFFPGIFVAPLLILFILRRKILEFEKN